MRELVTTDIGDHTTSSGHLHMIHERIEECKSIVEVESLEEEVGDESSEKCLISWIVHEVLIDLPDVLVSF